MQALGTTINRDDAVHEFITHAAERYEFGSRYATLELRDLQTLAEVCVGQATIAQGQAAIDELEIALVSPKHLATVLSDFTIVGDRLVNADPEEALEAVGDALTHAAYRVVKAEIVGMAATFAKAA